ncbi:MAG: hypothetical protein JXB05_08555 [Myxococcaceae bacterium]|nr:hypothetical protein [Myxococcaceae bacterium]
MVSGCGVSPQEELAALELESASFTLDGLNGLSRNGLGTNGLGTNGLSTSGLSIATMNSPSFVDWFNQDPVLADKVMKYVVTCAVEAGSSRVWTNPSTNIQYTWNGSLGLTPGWASGALPTEVEQQVITACLAAHTNKYGQNVPFSLQGLDATGTPIPVDAQEFLTFSEKEACFFGNLFQGEGVYAGNDAVWSSPRSSVRACGLESSASNAQNQCAPIQHVSPCAQICVPDAQGNYFLSCTYNGKNYRAITTRIRPVDVYVCGDGVCQISESCGTRFRPDNCMDCGPCPDAAPTWPRRFRMMRM